MSAKKRLWLIGLILAGAGVALARLVSAMFESSGAKLAVYAFGVLLALAGLGIIMYAMKK